MAVLTGVMVDDPRNLVSLFGMVVFLGVSWGMSYKPREVRWGPVVSGSKSILLHFSVYRLLFGLESKISCFLIFSLLETSWACNYSR